LFLKKIISKVHILLDLNRFGEQKCAHGDLPTVLGIKMDVDRRENLIFKKIENKLKK
jgi:hypothetical protein